MSYISQCHIKNLLVGETCDAMLVVVLVGVARWGWGYVRHCLTGSRMKNLDLRWRGRDRQAARVNGRCHAARAPTYRAAWLN